MFWKKKKSIPKRYYVKILKTHNPIHDVCNALVPDGKSDIHKEDFIGEFPATSSSHRHPILGVMYADGWTIDAVVPVYYDHREDVQPQYYLYYLKKENLTVYPMDTHPERYL